jgi:hypothetical protein
MISSKTVNTSSKYIVLCSESCSEGTAVKIVVGFVVAGNYWYCAELVDVAFYPLLDGLKLECFSGIEEVALCVNEVVVVASHSLSEDSQEA